MQGLTGGLVVAWNTLGVELWSRPARDLVVWRSAWPGLPFPMWSRLVHHEAIRWSKMCSGLLTLPALPGPHHILRAAAGHLQWDTGAESCTPALILRWDLEGEAFNLSGPWFLLQE